jgi:hypothetical protein
MSEFVELSNSMGLPDLAYSVLAAVETTKATPMVIASEAEHSDAAVGSPHLNERYTETIQVLVEMDVLRVITDKDQEIIYNEVHRPDIYTYATLYGLDIPPLGAVDFTQRGAQVWTTMLSVTASRCPLFGPAVMHSCHRISQRSGKILRLLLADNIDVVASMAADTTCDNDVKRCRQHYRVLHEGCASVPWRYYWWSRPMTCWYQLALLDVNPAVHWPKQDSLHHGYHDIDYFNWIMGMEWHLPDYVYNDIR